MALELRVDALLSAVFRVSPLLNDTRCPRISWCLLHTPRFITSNLAGLFRMLTAKPASKDSEKNETSVTSDGLVLGKMWEMQSVRPQVPVARPG